MASGVINYDRERKIFSSIDNINKNINGREMMKHLPFNTTELNPFNIDSTVGNWIAGFTETGEGTYFEKYWQNIMQFDTYHFKSQLAIKSFSTGAGIPRLGVRSWWGDNWTNWYPIALSCDLPIMESKVINPNGKDQVSILLQYETNDSLINVTMASAGIGMIGAYINNLSGKELIVKLTDVCNVNIRINVLYYKNPS